MSHQEQNQTDILTIPDDAPAVSVGYNLGQKYDSVDFDYAAFSKEAERLGLSSEAASKLTIDIHDLPKWARKEAGVGLGSYTPSNKKIGVYSISNETLSHELQHAADDEQGDLDPSKTSYRVGKKATRATPYIAAVSAANATYSVGLAVAGTQGANLSEKFLLPSGGVLPIVALGMIASSGYWLEKGERRARKAEEEAADVIKVSPKAA